jgi:uncharacterized OsmC-like protein
MWRLIMSTAAHKKQYDHIVNGIDTDLVMAMAGNIQQDENYGMFRFRTTNKWIDGSRSESSIQGFYAGGKENHDRKQPLKVKADQPEFLGGDNTAPNPVEHLLHSLNSCLTVTLSYHASVQGIKLRGIETSSEGEMNARGFFGISEAVSKGYERIKVRMKVNSDADEETLTRLAMYSPVCEMISKAVPVDFKLTTY